MTRERVLMFVGYGAFFWACFFLSAYWTFPYERLAAYLTDRVAESGSGYTLEIGSISPYWLTGVEFEDVQVRRAAAATPAPSASGAPAKDKPLVEGAVKVQSATARVGLFSLLFGNTSVDFGAELEAGELEGSFADNGEEKHVEATLENINLEKLGLLEALVTLPLKGMLNGEFDLTLAAQPTKTNGKIKLGLAKLTAGDGKAKLKLGSMGGLTIDPVAIGDVAIEVDVKEGVGIVRKLSSTGPDLKLDGSGDIRFAQPLSRSRLGLTLGLKLTDTYKNKSSRTKVMFSLLDGATSPQVAAAKTPDGGFQVRLGGTLTNPRVLPTGQRAAGGAPSASPAVSPGDDED
jgi:type II secretion system protein N